jgi:hypothetical protein
LSSAVVFACAKLDRIGGVREEYTRVNKNMEFFLLCEKGGDELKK